MSKRYEPPTDYIKRADALDAFDPDGDRIGTIEARGRIVRLPAADVAPVVPAKWILPDGDDDRPRCSNCDHIALADDDMYFLSNYCPNCGACMMEDTP